MKNKVILICDSVELNNVMQGFTEEISWLVKLFFIYLFIFFFLLIQNKTSILKHCISIRIKYCERIISWGANFGGFRGSLKPRNIMSNEIQNDHIFILCQLRNHEYKEPTNPWCLLQPRKLASTNKSTFTEW